MSDDIRSPLARKRDEWLAANVDNIDQWAKEARVDRRFISNRCEQAFLDGAQAQESLQRPPTRPACGWCNASDAQWRPIMSSEAPADNQNI